MLNQNSARINGTEANKRERENEREREEEKERERVKEKKIVGNNIPRVHTSQLCKLSTVNDLQYVAKQITALLLTCLHPLLLNRRNFVQPLASASMPFSVIESHHEMFISSKF